ncbi:MAG: secretion protein HlyD [Rhodospirillaceae bacterium]|nr:secretion protein HlyD [Rhodospirillaceae bacterium]
MKRRLAVLVILLAAAGIAAWQFDVPARLGWTDGDTGRLTLYGNVDIRQVELAFRVGGRVADMAVDEGDRVDEGQVLARLDARPYEDTLRAQQAQVAIRTATLDERVAGPREAEIAQARATVAERRAALDNAEQALQRASRLREGTTISQASLDEALASRDQAAARVTSAEEALNLLEEGTRPEEIAAARAELELADANLASARTALDDTALEAPSTGTILSRVREPGAVVAAGETVYVLSLETPVWVRAYISEPDLGRIHPGLAVEVVTDTAPDHPYAGQIGFISPVAEFTPRAVETTDLRADLVYRLRVVVDAPDSGLRQGMPVTVRVPDAAPADASQ